MGSSIWRPILIGAVVICQKSPSRKQKNSHQNRWRQIDRDKAFFPNRRWKACLLAHPGKPTPQQNRGDRTAERDRCTANTDHPEPFLLALQLQRSLAHAYLGRGYETCAGGDRNPAQ